MTSPLRVSVYRRLHAVLALLSLVPIWCFKFFPTTDGPSHLASAYMVRHFFAPDREYDQVFDFAVNLAPNWFSKVVLVPLMGVVDPLVAEKIHLSLYVLLFFVATWSFVRVVRPENLALAPLAAPFVFHFPLMMGFYNFSFSVPLMFVVLAVWWRMRSRLLEPWTMVILNGLLAALYFCHLVSQVAAICSVLLLSVFQLRGRVRDVAKVVLCLAPAAALPVWYVVSRGVSPHGATVSPPFLDFFTIRPLTTHDPRAAYTGGAVFTVIALLVVRTLALRVWRRAAVGLRDVFLLLALGASAMFFLLPDHLAQGAFFRDRVALYPFVLILVWLAPIERPRWRGLVAVVAASIAVFQLALVVGSVASLNKPMREYVSGVKHVKKNDTMLAISFEHMVAGNTRVSAFLHAHDYYTVRTGCIPVNTMEGRYTESPPLTFKPPLDPGRIGHIEGGTGVLNLASYPRPIDVILLWCAPPTFPCLDWIRTQYAPVHHRGRVQLWRRRD